MLVPYIKPHIGKLLLFTIYGIVDDADMGASRYGHAVLPGIYQDIVFGNDVRATVIAQHNAAAYGTRAAAPYSVAYNLYGAGGSARAFEYVYGIFGGALAGQVFAVVEVYFAAGAGYLVKLYHLATWERALYIPEIIVAHIYLMALYSIHARCQLLEVTVHYLYIAGAKQYDAIFFRKTEAAIFYGNIITVVQLQAIQRIAFYIQPAYHPVMCAVQLNRF